MVATQASLLVRGWLQPTDPRTSVPQLVATSAPTEFLLLLWLSLLLAGGRGSEYPLAGSKMVMKKKKKLAAKSAAVKSEKEASVVSGKRRKDADAEAHSEITKSKRQELRLSRKRAALEADKGEEEDEEEEEDEDEEEEGEGAEEMEDAPFGTPDAQEDPLEDDAQVANLMKLRALLAPAAAAAADDDKPEVHAAAEKVATDPGMKSKQASDETLQAPGPDWTSRYCVVDAAGAPTPLAELAVPLHPAVRSALQKSGYDPLFPIQAAVIPLLARSAKAALDHDSPYCCDVCVAAPTGQGKTLAYVTPIVQALLDRLDPRPRAVVLLPTRDLALQVHKVFEKIRLGLVGSGVAQIRSLCLVGAKPLTEEQRSLSEKPPDVIVCTPGRLAEHYLGRDATLDLSALRWFVVDEADRLLTQTYHRWLDVLERACSQPNTSNTNIQRRRPQKLLLSATMTWDPRKLAALKLLRPLYFFSSRSGQHATPAQLRQHYVLCRTSAKPLAVFHLLRKVLGGSDAASNKVVIFCQSVNTAHRLTRLLQICSAMPASSSSVRSKKKDVDEGEEEEAGDDDRELDVVAAVDEVTADSGAVLKSEAIAEFSSNLSQNERNALLKRFRSARIKCLVCSDVVARGIDIHEVTAVINYVAPSHIQTYIHRVGRTARAGRIGHTFTFVRKPQMSSLEEMLRQSADCWERIQKYPLPEEARDTQQQWWPKALTLLQKCMEREQRGELSINKPLILSDLGLAQEAHVETKKAALGNKTSTRPDPGRATLTGSRPSPSKASSLLDFVRGLRSTSLTADQPA
eukprot:TRINITY_DN4613_c0_g1_i1.p1 TRINITY_DN4613_c0_g1~~TRINITY_DN4613_c0_g1_i1.p1  ORF type:complete len:801 (+),score=153.26 TRINITY_DN4613_c0_g1_i1:1959-4361(+)